MTNFTLVLGNKTYSSWSLRAWLVMRQCGVAFEEIVIPLDRPETKAAIARYSPARRVPVLHSGDLKIWDTLAIAEFLHETFPQAGIWPADPAARALARSIVAEMHSGFETLRRQMPMDLRHPPMPPRDSLPEGQLGTDIGRVQEIWTDCRARFGHDGDFLFGQASAADAFYAPVVLRFATYGVPLEETAAAYRDAVLSWPALRDWIAAAKSEPWVITNS